MEETIAYLRSKRLRVHGLLNVRCSLLCLQQHVQINASHFHDCSLLCPAPVGEGHYKMIAGVVSVCLSVCLSRASSPRPNSRIKSPKLAGWKHITRVTREPAKALETLISGTRSRGRQIKGGLTTSKRIYSKEEVICDRQQNVSKDRKQWKTFVHAATSSATYG